MLKQFSKKVGVLAVFSIALALVAVTVSFAEETTPVALEAPAAPATPAAVDPEIQALSSADVVVLTTAAIRLQRQYIVASAMGLTAAEGEAFWPVYGEYWQEMGALRDNLAKLVENFVDQQSTLTEEQSAALVREYLSIRESEINIKQKYLQDFAKALPYAKVIRYYQIENKLDAILNYELTKQVPLMSTPVTE